MLAAIVSAGFGQSEAEAAERRVALIVGNSLYDHVETLANPVNDSIAMRDSLKSLGFEVFAGENMTLTEFQALIGAFKKAADGADTALVYFSGHGFQLRGVNYLVPRDAQLEDVGAIASETIRLDTLISEIQSPDRQTLIFLDACRNNPLPPEQRKDDGLAQVEAGNGVFVAFATQPGNISYDGRSKLSPFTKAITTHIGTPGQNISDLMINVRNDVERMTLHQQTPWDQSSLKRQVYFNGEAASGQTAAVSVAPPSQIAGLQQPGSEISPLERSTGVGTQNFDTLIGPTENVLVLPTVPGSPSNVILIPDAPIEIFGREDLVQGVQNEMARIGCYDEEVDGVWGEGSRQALVRYYQTKKLKLQDAEPTEFHYENLKRETGIVCVAPKPSYVPQVAKPARPGRPEADAPVRRTAARAGSAPAPKAISKPRRGAKASARPSNPPASRPAGRRAASAPQSQPAQSRPAQKTITNTRVLGAFR